MLFLVSVVFIYTPGDIVCTQVFGSNETAGKVLTWVIYLAIFAYYCVAALFPIDKIIGKIYPVFGAVLLFSALGIFIMIFVKGYSLANIWKPWILNGFVFEKYFSYEHFFPVFFVTVACGIMSGFHSTQITIVSRTIANEHDGQFIFYNMMIAEGFIAMVWAAGTMAMISLGAENHGIAVKLTENGAKYFALVRDVIQQISPISVVGVVCRNALGSIGGFVATIGIIILPVTSGDTAIRSLRLILAEAMQIKNSDTKKKLFWQLLSFCLYFVFSFWQKITPMGLI